MNFGEYLIEAEQTMDIVKTIFRDCQPYLKELRKEKAKHFFYRGTGKLGSKHIMEITPRQDRYPKDMPQAVHEFIDDYFYKRFRWKPRSEGVFVSYNQRDAENYGRVCLFFPIGKYEYIFSPEVQDLYSAIESNDDLINAIAHNEPDSYTLDYYRDEYDGEYGEGTGNGTWSYLGTDTGESDKWEAVKAAGEAEGIDIEDEDSMYDIEEDLEWVPNIDFDSYVEERWQMDAESKINDFEATLDTYQKNKLKEAMTGSFNESEVMWKCKKYYLVDYSYEDDLIGELLMPKNKDFINTIERVDNQMLLPFKWGKRKK